MAPVRKPSAAAMLAGVLIPGAPVNIPDSIACAQCGSPVHWDTSFGLSIPLDERKIKASDFCGLPCLAAWTAEIAAAALAGRKN